ARSAGTACPASGWSTASTSVHPGPSPRTVRPAAMPATGPPPWGTSTVRRMPSGTSTAPTTTVRRAARTPSSTRERSDRPPTSSAALSTPPRRVPRPPARMRASCSTGWDTSAVIVSPVAGSVLRQGVVDVLDPAQDPARHDPHVRMTEVDQVPCRSSSPRPGPAVEDHRTVVHGIEVVPRQHLADRNRASPRHRPEGMLARLAHVDQLEVGGLVADVLRRHLRDRHDLPALPRLGHPATHGRRLAGGPERDLPGAWGHRVEQARPPHEGLAGARDELAGLSGHDRADLTDHGSQHPGLGAARDILRLGWHGEQVAQLHGTRPAQRGR